MPFKDLDLPRLKTIPYPEADMLKIASGADFATPTLALATEGNRRVLSSSGIPELISADRGLGRGTHAAGTHISAYNFVLIRPGLSREQYTRTAIHEAAHGLRASFRDWIEPYTPTNDSEASFKRHYAEKALEEGFAEYWEAETYGGQVLGLRSFELIEHHKSVMEERRKDKVYLAGDKFMEREMYTYDLGHRWTLATLAMLESIMDQQSALRIIATAQATDINEVEDSLRDRKYPKFLNLPWKHALLYRFNTQAGLFLNKFVSQPNTESND